MQKSDQEAVTTSLGSSNRWKEPEEEAAVVAAATGAEELLAQSTVRAQWEDCLTCTFTSNLTGS